MPTVETRPSSNNVRQSVPTKEMSIPVETSAPVESCEVNTAPVPPPSEQPNSSSHSAPEQPRPQSIAPCSRLQSTRSIAFEKVENNSNERTTAVSLCQRPAPVKSQNGLRELILPKLITSESPSEEVLYNFKKRNREEVYYKQKTLGIFGNRPCRPQSQFNDFHCQLPSATVDSAKSSSTAAASQRVSPPRSTPFEEKPAPVPNSNDSYQHNGW